MTAQTILNVDDNPANRYIRSRALREAGFQVVEAATGQAALDAVVEKMPDLVLLDMKLPDISGLEVCRRIKKNPRTQRIPVVHISVTYVTEAAEAFSLDAGADIYLAEPVGPHEIASAVRTLLKLRDTETGLAAAEERLRLATEGAGIATWDIDVPSGAAVWSRKFYGMLGYELTQPPSWGAWIARARADDRDALVAALERSRRGLPFSVEHWIVRADTGEERCIAPYGRMHLDRDGDPHRLIGVAIDVTEKHRAEAAREQLLRQAQAAQQAAEEAARMKDEFLAVLSHELRTPMSAMVGWLDLIRTGQLTPEQHRTALETIERNARLQTQLVNDLLDVSRIVTGKMELEAGTVSVDQALENALQTARIAAGTKEIELVAPRGRSGWVVIGNPERLQQVFSNLLSNAVKFTPRGRRVEVRAETVGTEVRISVIDSGEGIAPELLPHIFDRFRQADSSSRRRHGGLGLGLAIVHSLVELHGGRVTAESAGEGRGATFTVTLPLAPEPGRAAAAPRGDPASGESLRGVRILAVDDEEDAVGMIEHMLRLQGATVRTALNAADALEAVRGWRPDILVLDIGMPIQDGYELLPRLRRELNADAGSLPAIALTGFAGAENSARAGAAAFQAHVAKPFERSAVCQLIARLAGEAKPPK
jgi:PAS domain S-box-containing protein